MYSNDKQLNLANIGDLLSMVKTPSAHTGDKWFLSNSCGELVCIADKTPLLVRVMKQKSLKSLKVPGNGLLRFREVRSSSINGDFLEVDKDGKKQLIHIANVPIDAKFEVVSETFAASLQEADKAQIELLAEPATRLANLVLFVLVYILVG